MTPAGVAAGLHLFVWLPHDAAEEKVVRQAHAAGTKHRGRSPPLVRPGNAPPAILIGYGAQHEEVLDRTVASLSFIVQQAVRHS